MPTLDNSQSTQGLTVTSLTTASWTIAGSDRLLVAASGCSASSPPAISEVRWGGAGGTLLTQVGATQNHNTFQNNSLWRLIAPTAASQTLYTLYAATADEAWVGGSSWTDVNQVTPLSTDARATGTTATATVDISSAATEVVVDAVYQGNNGTSSVATIAVGASQTSLQEQENINTNNAGGHSWETGASTTTMSWSISNGAGSTLWGIIAVAIKPASGAGTTGVGRGPSNFNGQPMIRGPM